MNAMPMQLTPVSAAPSQPAPGKQHNSDAPEVPFSKVLSGEVANKRNGGEAHQDPQTKTDSASTQQAADPAQAVAVTKGKAADADAVQLDPQDPLLAESSPDLPTALLALGFHPDQLKIRTAGTPVEQTDAAILNPDAQTAPKGRKGQMPLPMQGGAQRAGDDAGEQAAAQSPLDKPALKTVKAAASLPGAQATTASATAAATATAFSAQLVAARQSEAMKFTDSMPGFVTDPGLRATPHALLDAATSMAGAAANKLAPSVGSTAWSQALGEKVVWMAAGAQQTASLTLNPPNMGPLQIVLNLSNDQATASFFSAQPEVRQALEAAFPRLREMLNEAGIELSQATVSADTPRQNETSDGKAQHAAPPFPGSPEAVSVGQAEIHIPLQRSGRGLVDTFA